MKPIRLLAVLFVASAGIALAGTLPQSDQRATRLKDLNTPRTFPEIKSRSDWQARAKEIRESTLVSCGLWPLPERTPLQAEIFGRVDREGYSIEKVYFQTYPGFYLAGNLYRPLSKGQGPFPAVLNPHGHGKFGRLHDDELFSNPARCIQLARMGIIAFAYDMAGYNDTMQLGAHRKFFLKPELQLWNISLMGLQTWNSIRALDFLQSLPDVNRQRLGCTGESGGGTQTFMLGAVDPRLTVQAPMVMVSSTMQGGCQCENAPGLRVEYSNMEIAASAAPRPQLLVAATGDWTKLTLTVEGPAVAGAYKLLGATNKLHYEILPFNHNYNRTSREVMYPWFGHWLLDTKWPGHVEELPHPKEADEVFRVWPDGNLPANALNEEQFIQALIRDGQAQLARLQPRDRSSLAEYKRVVEPAWRHSLQLEFPAEVIVEKGLPVDHHAYTGTPLTFGRPERGDRIPAILFTPIWNKRSSLVVLVHPEGKSTSLNLLDRPTGLAKTLVEHGHAVLLLDTFLVGELAKGDAAGKRNYFDKFFTTYNRTEVQERVQDLITACTLARKDLRARNVVLCGVGRAGLWALLAAPAANAVVADCDAFDPSTDEAFLSQDLFAPGLRKLGGLAGVATLAAPNPILLHNTGEKFTTIALGQTYGALKAGAHFRTDRLPLGEGAIAEWIGKIVRH